jgi:hypothetical protein
MAKRTQSAGLSRLAHLIERLKTDARLARDAAEAEKMLDVRALLDGMTRSLRACSEKVTERKKEASPETR